MIISANQPYFCPFPGFFYKACLSDALVILDQVQFPRGTTWVSRNRFKNDQGTLRITIPVWKKGRGLQPIDWVRICHEGRWPGKYRESLTNAYRNAPFLEEHFSFIDDMFSKRFERLVDLNLAAIRYLMTCLHIETGLVLQSDLGVTGKGDQLLTDICKAMNASTFLAQRQAKKFLDQDVFEKHGIECRYFDYVSPVYPQLWGNFLANLSTFDLLLNCGPKARDVMLLHQSTPHGIHSPGSFLLHPNMRPASR